MVFDRKKFRGASLEKNKEFGKKIDAMTKFVSGENSRPDYHEIKEGTNVFRICPPHDPEDPSMQAKVTTWLPAKVEKKGSDGKSTGEFEIKDRPIFNSRVHGGTQKDLVEEYINFVYKSVYEEIQDKDERAKRLAPISGWRDKKSGKWNPGIRFSTSYVLYAFKDGKIGRLEIYPADKNKMEELNISEDADEPITTDCFSDPDNGVSLIITRQKNDKGKMENIFSKREFNPKKHKTWEAFMEQESLTDAQLEELSKQQSLKEIFQNVYKRSDFKKALEGLQIFDEKNKFNVFENDDFLSIVEEIDAYYPEDTETNEQESSDENNEVALEDMTREELKAFIEEKELDIVVKKAMSDDDIRDAIYDAMGETQDKVEEAIEEKEEEPEVAEPVKEEKSISKKEDKKDLPWEKEEKTASNNSQSIKDKLAEIKAKMAEGKK